MKVIGYVRVSTKSQDLKRQEVKIKDFCNIRGYELVKLIMDDGISGAINDRAGYNELLSLTGDEAELIIVSELSRLSRQEDILSTLNDIQNLTKKNFELIFLDNPEKTYSGTLDLIEILTLSFTAFGAAQERKTIKKRNQEGKEVLFRVNPYSLVDSIVPYGFNKVETPTGRPKYIIEENPEQIEVIKLIYKLTLEGMTLGKISRYLFNAGYRTNRNQRFSKQYITNLIQNPIYKGERRRKEIVSYIKPVVDPSDWEAAQNKFKENINFSSSGITMYNPLKGIIKCRCGRAMIVKKKSENKFSYKCSQIEPYYTGLKCEYYDSISYGFTNSTILSYLKSLDFIEVEGKVSDKIKQYQLEIESIEKQVNGFKKTQIDLEDKIKNYFDAFAEAPSTELRKSIQEKIDSTTEKIDSIKQTIKRKEKEIITWRNRIRDLETYSRTEDFENLDIESQSKLFKKYIKRIETLPVTTMQGYYKIELNIGVIEYIATSKVQRNPIAVKVPDIYTLNDDLTLSFDYYIASDNNKPMEFNNPVRKTITIQEYLKICNSDDVLDIDITYREKMK